MTQKFITCLNGTFIDDDQASVALADRGFRFGDGIFSTIALHRGTPYQWVLHMTRLHDGLAAINIDMPKLDWLAFANAVIKKNKASDGFLRIAISRGVGSRGYLPHTNIAPTWAIEYLPALPAPNTPLRLWLSDMAKIPPRCLPTNYKLAQGLNNTLAAMQAQKNHCDDALQLTLEGIIAETSAANLFWITNNELFTPALTTNCLNGTMRAAILRLSPVTTHEVNAPLEALKNAESVFVTNARLGVQPVASLAPNEWNFNTNHPLIHTLQQQLQQDRDDDRAAFLAQFPTWSA